MRRINSFVTPRILPFFVGVLSFALLYPAARLDYDPHHDGVMVASALGVAQGGRVQSDVFAQYGPVSAWIQSVLVKGTAEPVVMLRLFTVTVLAMTAFLLADFGRRINKSAIVTSLSAMTWIALADVFNGVPLLPWSSVLSTAFLVLGCYLLTPYLSADSLRKMQFPSIFLSGFLFGILPFTRLNVGTAGLVGFIAFTLILGIRSARVQRIVVKIALLGAITGGITVVTLLLLNSGLSAWWEQSVSAPSQWAESALGGRGLLEAYVDLAFAHDGQIFFVSLIGVTFAWSMGGSTHRPRLRQWIFALVVGAGAYIMATNASYQIWSPSALASVNAEGMRLRLGYMALLLWAGVAICAIKSFVLIRKMVLSRESSIESNWLLLLCIVAVANTSQVLPVTDSRHAWWAMAPLIAVVFLITSPLFARTSRFTAITATSLLLISIPAWSSYREYLHISRSEAPRGSVAAGMKLSTAQVGNVSFAAEYLDRFNLLSKLVTSDQNVLFVVRDADISVFDRQYRSADSAYVVWAPADDFSDRLAKVRTVVFDRDLADVYNTELLSNGFKTVGASQSIVIWRKGD